MFNSFAGATELTAEMAGTFIKEVLVSSPTEIEIVKYKTRRAAIYMRVARAPRAWIYCRTAEPNAFALKIQQEELTAFAEKNHYDIVGCTSRHEAGTTMTRPGLAEITNAALQGKMDILLVLNASRLGRDIWNTLEYVGWLEKHKVEVVCLNGDFSVRGVRQFPLAKQTVV